MNRVKQIYQIGLATGFIAVRALLGLFLTTFLVFAALFYTPGGGEREHLMVAGQYQALEAYLLPLQKAGYELIMVDDVAQARERLTLLSERVHRLHRPIASEVQMVLVANPSKDFSGFSAWLETATYELPFLPLLAFHTRGKTSATGGSVDIPNGETLKNKVISRMLPRKQLLADFWRWVRFFPGYDNLGQPMASEVWASTWRTLYLVAGSLILALGIALIMVTSAQLWPDNVVVRVAFYALNFASGFHILIIGLGYVVITGNIGSFRVGMLVVLALGNGTLSDYVAVLRDEIQRIFSQDYVLAALGRGSGRLRHVICETGLMLMDVTVSKIPLLVGSTIVLEVLCAYYGLGWYIVSALGADPRDINMTMVTTTLIVGGLIGINLVSDAIRMALDPRVKG